MTHVNTQLDSALAQVFKAQDNYIKAQDKALAIIAESAERLADEGIAWLGDEVSYEVYGAKRTEFKAGLTEQGLSSDAVNKRWSRFIEVLERSEHNFVPPKSDKGNAEAVRKHREGAKAEFEALSEPELVDAFENAVAEKDYKTISALGREQDRRKREAEKAEKAKTKVERDNLLATFKELTIDELRLLNWVVYHQKEVREIIAK